MAGANQYFNCRPGASNLDPNDPNNPCTEQKVWSYEDAEAGGRDLKPHPGFCDRVGNPRTPQCGTAATDATPYLVEVVDTGSNKYWHMVMGAPASGWAQEVYYKNDGSGSSQGGIQSPSGGAGGGNIKGNNAMRPLHKDPYISGNGSGRPTTIAIRMYMNTGGVELDFFKSEFDRKPKITQTEYFPGEIKSEFMIDMRNNTYFTAYAPQAFEIRQLQYQLANDPNFPKQSMDFTNVKMVTDPAAGNAKAYEFKPLLNANPGADVHPTGGMYTWNGQIEDPSKVKYTYADGNWDVFKAGWLHWWNGSSTWKQGDLYPCDPAINADFCQQ
ncbi:MAG: hypothetical protein HY272_07050 [Gammaproteobacteria bacterium]|nr:hypothetical protein [Gammaproteobacteria bacterium]